MSSSAFVLTLPLKTSPKEEKILAKHLDAGRMLFNACLGEGLRRLALARESKLWQKAQKTKDKKERSALFRQAQKYYAISDYDLQAFAIKTRKQCHLKDHLDANTTQKIATRVYGALSQYMYNKRGKPRFKPKGRFHSLEGKGNKQGVRFKDGKLVWGKLSLPLIYDRKDKNGVEAHALNRQTKYVRLVCKTIKGKDCWYAQLIQEGSPKQKEKNVVANSVVGLDLGPSSIAAVSANSSLLEPFCPGLENIDADIKKKQQQLDRSRRNTNPNNYNENGTIKAGPKRWHRSKRYQKLQGEISEEQRRLAESRKNMQGALANRILGMGIQIKTEKLSYKSFQKNFGKSVGKRAPGMFMEILRRKALSAGGAVIEFPTRTTKLSQTCHGCGKAMKKKLSERWHDCPCGVGPVQRDLYSAFLASCVTSNNLDMDQAEKLWSGAKPLLEQAISRVNQSAIGELRLSSFGLSKAQRQSASSVKDGSMPIDGADVVGMATAVTESCEEMGSIAIKTPRIYP